MLEVSSLAVLYGKHRALDGVALKVRPGEIVVILGANGAGKSTLLKAIAGICEGHVAGHAAMAGEPILGLPPHQVVERGIALVPEGRGVFPDLSVRENLMLGANPARAREEAGANYDRIVRLFPKLAERAGQTVRTMSGGEQQMVAIGRAMMSNPVILMLDEPSLGLSPLLSKELFQSLKSVRDAGLGILLVEQNARLSLGIADRGYLLENGEIQREAPAEALRSDPAVQAAYLGGAAGQAAPVATAAQPAASGVAPPDLPATVKVHARPVRSVPASDLVGFDIDALVAGAADRARPPAGPAARPRARLQTGEAQAAVAARSDRLRAALAEIENAARNAREGAQRPRPALAPLRPERPRAGAPRRPAPAEALAPPPPSSEPRPGGRVEVWRRRPGTSHFDRMENQDA